MAGGQGKISHIRCYKKLPEPFKRKKMGYNSLLTDDYFRVKHHVLCCRTFGEITCLPLGLKSVCCLFRLCLAWLVKSVWIIPLALLDFESHLQCLCDSFLSFYPSFSLPSTTSLPFFISKSLVAANTYKQPFTNACGVFTLVWIERDWSGKSSHYQI